MTPAPDHAVSSPDRLEWRPVKPAVTRRPPIISDPLLEPYWSGVRVLAHFRALPDSDELPRLDLIDEDGRPADDIAPAAGAALRDSVMALEAVIDGILTDQPTRDGTGTALISETHVPRMSMLLPGGGEVTYAPRGRPHAEKTEVAFVAVDLLSVDGQVLLDFPLLERKRQLESLFVQSELVRVSPVARPPIGPWLNSWQAAGFRGVMMKAANSRYRPGDFTVEWTVIRKTAQRA